MPSSGDSRSVDRLSRMLVDPLGSSCSGEEVTCVVPQKVMLFSGERNSWGSGCSSHSSTS